MVPVEATYNLARGVLAGLHPRVRGVNFHNW